MWTTSARPGESALHYTLLNGCPAIVLPARPGAPLIAWDTMTLEQLHALRDELPPAAGTEAAATTSNHDDKRFRGAVDVLCEYMGLCVDWDRVRLEKGEVVESEKAGGEAEPGSGVLKTEDEKKAAVRDALAMLVIAAVCSKESKQVKKEVDADRAGIVVFRIP